VKFVSVRKVVTANVVTAKLISTEKGATAKLPPFHHVTQKIL